MGLWKLVLERPNCEIPQHVVSAFSPSTRTSFETVQTDGETDNFGKTEACSLKTHKPSASFCMDMLQDFLLFSLHGTQTRLMHQMSNSGLNVFCSLHHIL